MPRERRSGPVAEFCEQLRLLVRDSGLSQSQVAQRVGKSGAAVSELLNGRRTRPPAWDDVRRIVDCCGAAKGLDGRTRGVEAEAWRYRHGSVVELYEAVLRLDRPLEPGQDSRTGSPSDSGPEGKAEPDGIPGPRFRVDPRSVPTASQTGWVRCLRLLTVAGDHPVRLRELLDEEGHEAFLRRLHAVCRQVLDGFPGRVRAADRLARTVACHAVLPVARLTALLDAYSGELAARPTTARRWIEAMEYFADEVAYGPSGSGPVGEGWEPWEDDLGDRLRSALDGDRQSVDLRAAADRLAALVEHLAFYEPELWLLLGEWSHVPSGTGTALDGLPEALSSSPDSLPCTSDAARTVAGRPAGELGRPLVAGVEAAAGDTPGSAPVVVPRLGSGYVDPAARWAVLHDDAMPYAEAWWATQSADVPVGLRLAAHFSGVAALHVPLLVLGHPGVGKSLLTRVTMARLPADDFLPVRVELRSVAADAPVQRQIEEALEQLLGERVGWPDLVRGAPGRIPVVLLDGFDELLQAAETEYWDYLQEVADFQAREMAAGRPLAVVVTSRTVVMHRVRVPDCTRALCLEPFDERHRRRWLEVWNAANRGYFTSSGLRPLDPAVLDDRLELAAQPLLLLLLALYDSVDNGLARAQESRASGAELFERLLLGFLRRQVRKRHARDPGPSVVDREAEQEMARLGVVALAMFTRGQQSVGAEQVASDARALLGPDSGWADDRAFGRFFFIHEAQARVRGRNRRTYEFLHATFNEYLVARTIWRSLRTAAEPPGPDGCRAPLPVGPLSFAQLTDRAQVLERLAEMGAAADPAASWALADTIPRLLGEALNGALPPADPAYEPKPVPPLTRLAHYTSNLVLLHTLWFSGGSVSKLLGTRDAPAAWHRLSGLWESQLAAEEWDDLTRHLVVDRTWYAKPETPDEPVRDLRLRWAGHDEPAGLGAAGPDWFAQELGNAGTVRDGLARRAAFRCSLDQQLLLRGDGAMPYRVGRVWEAGSERVGVSTRSGDPSERMVASLVALLTPGHLRAQQDSTALHTACLQALGTAAPSRSTQDLGTWAVAAALVRDLPWLETREACARISETVRWGDRLRVGEEVLHTLAWAVHELRRREDVPRQEAAHLDALAQRLPRTAGRTP